MWSSPSDPLPLVTPLFRHSVACQDFGPRLEVHSWSECPSVRPSVRPSGQSLFLFPRWKSHSRNMYTRKFSTRWGGSSVAIFHFLLTTYCDTASNLASRFNIQSQSQSSFHFHKDLRTLIDVLFSATTPDSALERSRFLPVVRVTRYFHVLCHSSRII